MLAIITKYLELIIRSNMQKIFAVIFIHIATKLATL